MSLANRLEELLRVFEANALKEPERWLFCLDVATRLRRQMEGEPDMNELLWMGQMFHVYDYLGEEWRQLQGVYEDFMRVVPEVFE